MDSRDVVAQPDGPSGTEPLHDASTGLLAPAAWDALLTAESARCARYGRTTTVVFMEIAGPDELSAVWGEQVGARSVSSVAGELGRQSRTSDLVGRLGSRRFGILLPETSEVAAVNYIERVREACGEVLRGTGSSGELRFGWADANRTRTLLAAADIALDRLAADGTRDGEGT